MSDMKTLYDRVLTAQANIENVKNQINVALALGTPEGDTQALEMESALDTAIAEEQRWHAFYDKLAGAQSETNTAKKFVPIEAEDIPAEDANPKGTMTRAEFQNLNPAARVDFLRSGGKVIDEKKE